MLTSAGIRNESLRNTLKKLVGDVKIKIAFIPTAANVEEGDKDWLINDLVNCKKFGEVDIVDISALPKDKWLPRLEWANVIFVGGGNTTYLMECVRKFGLADEIENLLKTRVYVGISAGSLILSDSIQASSEYLFKVYGDEVRDPPRGLGLVNFHVRPHFGSAHFPKLTKENLEKVFEDSDLDAYVLDDESGVVWIDGKVEVVSEGKWIKFDGKTGN